MPQTLGPAARPLVVIPCLNEIEHIEPLVHQMSVAAARRDGRVVVADGGSRDGSREAVAAIAARDPSVVLLDNPARVQSAGINAAVAAYGSGFSHLVRIDAHGGYPDDYVAILLDEAERTGAAAVVVGMVAAGERGLQRISAMTQNARIGNGGSRHRFGAGGRFVDHGHHALIRLDPFRAVGGYDPAFSHNEDAELDTRLTAAGYRIWLTGRTRVTYYPRRTVPALARQYFNHGRGRARNIAKHRSVPKLRQVAAAAVLPAILPVLVAPAAPILAAPALLWVLACLAAGATLAVSARNAALLFAGPVSMVMHAAWSAGFWSGLIEGHPRPREARA